MKKSKKMAPARRSPIPQVGRVKFMAALDTSPGSPGGNMEVVGNMEMVPVAPVASVVKASVMFILLAVVEAVDLGLTVFLCVTGSLTLGLEEIDSSLVTTTGSAVVWGVFPVLLTRVVFAVVGEGLGVCSALMTGTVSITIKSSSTSVLASVVVCVVVTASAVVASGMVVLVCVVDMVDVFLVSVILSVILSRSISAVVTVKSAVTVLMMGSSVGADVVDSSCLSPKVSPTTGTTVLSSVVDSVTVD